MPPPEKLKCKLPMSDHMDKDGRTEVTLYALFFEWWKHKKFSINIFEVCVSLMWDKTVQHRISDQYLTSGQV